MPGRSVIATLPGDGKDRNLSVLLNNPDATVHYEVYVLMAHGNSGTVNVGRQAPVFPFAADKDHTFHNIRTEEIMVNDNGTAGTMYVDLSGAFSHLAQAITTFSPPSSAPPPAGAAEAP